MTMTFETAFVYLKQGKMIRRAYWPNGIYIRKREMDPDDEAYLVDVEEVVVDESGVHSLFDGEGCNSWFWSSDFFAEDWEVLDESTR